MKNLNLHIINQPNNYIMNKNELINAVAEKSQLSKVNAKKAVTMEGMKGLPVHNILFDGVNWYATREGMTIDFAEDITFQNCIMTPQKESSLKHTKNINWNGSPME